MDQRIIVYMTYFAVAFGLFAVIFTVYGAVKRGIKMKIKFFDLAIELNINDKNNITDIKDATKKEDTNVTTFETLSERCYKETYFQSKVYFRLSVSATVLGIVLILLKNYQNPGSQYQNYAALYVICQAITILFFSQSNRAQKKMIENHIRLREDNDKAEARQIVETFNDGPVKDLAKFVIIGSAYDKFKIDTDFFKNTTDAASKDASSQKKQKMSDPAPDPGPQKSDEGSSPEKEPV